MKSLDLLRRISRAKRAGEDVSVLERELATIETESRAPRPKRRPTPQQQKTIARYPLQAELLRRVLSDAKRGGHSLGWVMHEFKRRHGSLPRPALWRAVVGVKDKHDIIDAQVSRAAMRARSTGF